LFAGTWQEFETYCEQCTQKSVQALKIDWLYKGLVGCAIVF
jgi:hypothetical protein